MTELIPLYRYEDVNTTAGLRIEVQTFWAFRETPEGYWFSRNPHIEVNAKVDSTNDHRWCAKEGKRLFARRDKEQAKADFIARKVHQYNISEKSQAQARLALSMLGSLAALNAALGSDLQLSPAEEAILAKNLESLSCRSRAWIDEIARQIAGTVKFAKNDKAQEECKQAGLLCTADDGSLTITPGVLALVLSKL